MPEQAKLSIVNYGFNIRSKMDAEQQKEDDALIKAARSIITKHNFGKGAVMITEAYHTDLANGNHYIYTSDNMDKLIKSFYEPFMTPFQCFHNDIGKAIGTNIGAKFIRKPVQLNRGVASGYGKLATFIPENSTFEDELALDLIQSRRFMAVSIGSKSPRSQMICTICGKSIFHMDCEHMPGQEYEGQKCCIKIGNPQFIECSMAGGNPADIDAMVRRMDCFDTNGHQTMEPVVDMINDPWSVAIYDNAMVSQFNLAMDLSDLTNKNTDGSADMADTKTIADIISSYETRIANMAKENEILALALVNANNTIATLTSKTESADEKATDTEKTEPEIPGSEEEPAKDTSEEEPETPAESQPGEETAETEAPPAEDKPETPEETASEEEPVKDEGTDSPAPEETQENSSENGTESPVKNQDKPEEISALRRMRQDRLAGSKSGIQISSKSYRV